MQHRPLGWSAATKTHMLPSDPPPDNRKNPPSRGPDSKRRALLHSSARRLINPQTPGSAPPPAHDKHLHDKRAASPSRNRRHSETCKGSPCYRQRGVDLNGPTASRVDCNPAERCVGTLRDDAPRRARVREERVWLSCFCDREGGRGHFWARESVRQSG